MFARDFTCWHVLKWAAGCLFWQALLQEHKEGVCSTVQRYNRVRACVCECEWMEADCD